MKDTIIIINPNEGSYKELLFENKDNHLTIDGFKLLNNKTSPVSFDDVNYLIKELFFKTNLNKIGKYLDYDIYYDEENSLKHFIKDGKENYFLFLTKNGVSQFNYDIDKDKKKSKKVNLRKKYKIVLKKEIILLSVLGIALSLTALSPNITKSLENHYYEYISDLEGIDVYKVYNYIDSSNNLTEEQKDFLNNKDLFELALPYYENTEMEQLIKRRIKDLAIIYYDDDEDENVIGYYEGDNIIHLRPGNEDEALGHEMIHLFQNPNCYYWFFIESTADILANEYYDGIYEGYEKPVYNAKLLMNIIGPEPILEYIFGGDFSKIDEILKNNLSSEDYNRILECFNDYDLSDETEDEVTKLISKLYYNLYNEDIKDNRDIFDLNGNLISNIYFNEKKMADYNTTLYTLDNIPKEYVSHDNHQVIDFASISEEEADKFINEGYWVTKRIVSNTSEVTIVSDSTNNDNAVSIEYNGNVYLIDKQDAINKGYISYKYYLLINDEAKKNLNIAPEGSYLIPKINVPNYDVDYIDGKITYIVKTDTTKTRFPKTNDLNNIKRD